MLNLTDVLIVSIIKYTNRNISTSVVANGEPCTKEHPRKAQPNLFCLLVCTFSEMPEALVHAFLLFVTYSFFSLLWLELVRQKVINYTTVVSNVKSTVFLGKGYFLRRGKKSFFRYVLYGMDRFNVFFVLFIFSLLSFSNPPL